MLLQEYPSAVGLPDGFNRFPLHLAIENRAGPEVVIALLQACPDAASHCEMEHGKSPLHYATEKHAGLSVVAALLQAYDGAASTADWFGQLPLHYAAQHQAGLEVVAALIQAYPEAARMAEQVHTSNF